MHLSSRRTRSSTDTPNAQTITQRRPRAHVPSRIGRDRDYFALATREFGASHRTAALPVTDQAVAQISPSPLLKHARRASYFQFLAALAATTHQPYHISAVSERRRWLWPQVAWQLDFAMSAPSAQHMSTMQNLTRETIQQYIQVHLLLPPESCI